MCDEIKTNAEAVSLATELIQRNLGDYCSLKLDSIYSCAPVPGSSIHDDLGSSVATALASWSSLLTSDASAVVATGAELEGLDSQFAKNVLGIGGV